MMALLLSAMAAAGTNASDIDADTSAIYHEARAKSTTSTITYHGQLSSANACLRAVSADNRSTAFTWFDPKFNHADRDWASGCYARTDGKYPKALKALATSGQIGSPRPGPSPGPSHFLDLSGASIVVPTALPPLLATYAAALASQVKLRTGLTWNITSTSPSKGPSIHLNAVHTGEVDRNSLRAEGFTITVTATPPVVTISGVDCRGVLYGIGRLLRMANLSLAESYYTPRSGRVALDFSGDLPLTTAPDRPMRGVQIGYRPKTNSYDGLTPASFEEMVFDLAMFGANQIELIPRSFDDAPFSPHFALSHDEMNVAMSAVLAKYGLNVSLWYPACDPTQLHSSQGCPTGNYSDPAVMAAARADWRQVFSSMARIDSLFINAGDPGGQRPDALVMIAREARSILLQYHPHADVWICPQDWKPVDYARWVELASTRETKQWLGGIAYGPGMLTNLPTFQNATYPINYPIRLYPDITHSTSDQLPVPNWKPTLSVTNHREPINPRPRQHGHIAASQKHFADGAVTYNEGCQDDVNKHVWLAVMWGADGGGDNLPVAESDAVVRRWLFEYCKLHFGPSLAALTMEGIYSLERNWIVQGDAYEAQVNSTLSIFRAVERSMSVRDRWKWRLQQLLYRANFDAFATRRAKAERAGEEKAVAHLREALTASGFDLKHSVAMAEGILDAAAAEADRDSMDLWVELRVWAEALYQSIHQQFSVPLYGSEYTKRGATLDTARLPQSDAPYLRVLFQECLAMTDVDKARRKLAEAVGWQVVALGDFYDDLGEDKLLAPRYVVEAGVNGSQPQMGDQAVYQSPSVAMASPSYQYYEPRGQHSGEPPTLPNSTRRSWLTYVQSMPILPSSSELVHRLRAEPRLTPRPSLLPPPPFEVTGLPKGDGPQTPIALRYPNLPKSGKWIVSVTGPSSDSHFNVTANGKPACTHHSSVQPTPMRTGFHSEMWSCSIPPEYTAPGGDLELRWTSDCCTIILMEVWLRRQH